MRSRVAPHPLTRSCLPLALLRSLRRLGALSKCCIRAHRVSLVLIVSICVRSRTSRGKTFKAHFNATSVPGTSAALTSLGGQMVFTQPPVCTWEPRPPAASTGGGSGPLRAVTPSRSGHRPLPPGLSSCVPAPAPYFPKKTSPFVPAPAPPLRLRTGRDSPSSLGTRTTTAPRDAAVSGT